MLSRLRNGWEAVMPKVITLDKGSKRRLKQIRWKLAEILSLGLLELLGIAAGGLAILWELHHEQRYSEPAKDPQMRDAQPTSP